MGVRIGWLAPMLAALMLAGGLALALGRNRAVAAPLPRIGSAPALTLTTQDGERLSLNNLRGQVVAITFIFASCTDTCPLLTAKLVGVRH